MRELILTMSVSLDGFVAGPEGDVTWMFGGDQEAKAWKLQTVSNASLHIMGSRTFEGMAAFWPTSTDAFAPAMNEIPKAVFSKQGSSILNLENAPSAPLQPGAESWREAYVAGGDLSDEITKLKTGDGKPIIAHGGAALARSLIALELVDRYALLVHPVALGKGLPIFSNIAQVRRLELISSTAFPEGAVAQIYRPA